MSMGKETLGHKTVVQESEWTMEMLCDCQAALRACPRFGVIKVRNFSSHAEPQCRCWTGEWSRISIVKGLPGKYKETREAGE